MASLLSSVPVVAAPLHPNPETDRGVATLLIATAQKIQNETTYQKELNHRKLGTMDREEAERCEEQNSKYSSRKRDREYREAQNELEHQNRLIKLQGKIDNEQRSYQCGIEQETKKKEYDLAKKVRNATRVLELDELDIDTRKQTELIEAELAQLKNARNLARLQRNTQEVIEDDRIAQRKRENMIVFEARHAAIKDRYRRAKLEHAIVSENDNISLFEKYGLSIPGHFFE